MCIYYARKNETRKQLLIDHLKNVAEIASSFDCMGIKNILYFTGLMHDIGKANRSFQEYLIDEKYKKGTIWHSLPSAQIAYKILKDNDVDQLIIEIITMSIDAHHGGLDNGINPNGKYEFIDKICDGNPEKIKINKLKNDKDNLSRVKEINDFIDKQKELDLDSIMLGIKRESVGLSEKLRSMSEKKFDCSFFVHLITRYVYSCLVDADRLDARNFDNGQEYENDKFKNEEKFMNLERIFTQNLEKLNRNNSVKTDVKVNEFRKNISEKCLEASQKEIGIYKLEVPTGGGKTLSSLRFAINHLLNHKMDRIIYVIPYLSITDQTAKSFREILEKEDDYETILEANSNFIPPDNDSDILKYEYMESRWDNNIVITTMVNFLESTFSNRASLQRKFHNYANSVFIFDEIQSLPPYTINMFNQLANFLNLMLNSTIILCSATQIPLDKTNHPIIYSPSNHLIGDNFKIDLSTRVKCIPLIQRNDTKLEKYEYKNLTEKIMEQNQSSLVIVNTKKNALELYKEVYEYVKLDNIKVDGIYCLTTYMCSEHRKEIIAKIKDDLKNKKYIICISTQLIEAGVDISFECVFREKTGIDSLIQAAGRCNRNNEFAEQKNIYLFDLRNTNVPKEIQYSCEITDLILNNEKNHEKLLSSDVIDSYYDIFFDRGNSNQKFDYSINVGYNDLIKLYDLHSSNKKFFKKSTSVNQKVYIKCAYKKIADEFKIITNKQKNIIVQFNDEAKDLVAAVRNNLVDKITIAKLNKYTINLYEEEFNKMKQNVLLEEINGSFYILAEENYSRNIGIEEKLVC